MATGAAILAATDNSDLHVVSQKALRSGSSAGFYIPLAKLGINAFGEGLAVNPFGIVYAVGGPGLVAVEGVPGTTRALGTITVPSSDPISAMAAAPDGSIAVFENDFERGGYVYFFASVTAGGGEIGLLIPPLGLFNPTLLAYDRSGQLFVTNGGSLFVFAPHASINERPIAFMQYSSGGPALAVDSADNIYLLTGTTSALSISAYSFKGVTFHKLWSVPAPPGAHWLSILE